MRGRAGLDWRAYLNGQAIFRGRTYICPYWNWCGPCKKKRREGAWEEGEGRDEGRGNMPGERERREGRLIRGICIHTHRKRERERERDKKNKTNGAIEG